MGRPAKKFNQKNEKEALAVNPKIVRDLWGEIAPPDHQALLKEKTSKNWEVRGSILKGCCPFHTESTPSFVIDTKKQYAKCYGGTCGKYFTDPIQFYKEVSGNTTSYAGTLDYLKKRFDLRSIPRTAIRDITKLQRHRRVKRLVFECLNQELIDAVAIDEGPQVQQLVYAQDAVEYLSSRGITGGYQHLPIGVFPPYGRLEELILDRMQTLPKEDARNIRKDWETFENLLQHFKKDISWVGSIVFFTGANPHDVCRIKLRKVPQRNANEYQKQNFEKDLMVIDDDLENSNGVFGLFGVDPYMPFFGNKETCSFVCMEGEFDALSIMHNQFKSGGNIATLAFSGGGGSVESLDRLTNYGFDTAYLVGDHDAGGEKFVKRIMESTSALSLRVFSWPEELRKYKDGTYIEKLDPDKAVTVHGFNVVQNALCETKNYDFSYLWAVDKASYELDLVDKNDVRQQTGIATVWLDYIKNPEEQRAYLSQLGKNYNIDTQTLESLIKYEDNPETFTERLKEHLSKRLEILEVEHTSTSALVTVWGSDSNGIFIVDRISKRKQTLALEMALGKPLLKIINTVREPSFTVKTTKLQELDGKDIGEIHNYKQEVYTRFLDDAFSECVIESVRKNKRRKLGHGLQCVPINPLDLDSAFELYLLEGLNLYKGRFNEEDKLVWEDNNGPANEKVIVYTNCLQNPRSFINSDSILEDLNAPPPSTPRELYDTIRDMLDIGWSFENHENTCDLLAASILAIMLCDCVGNFPMFFVSAASSSGKTNLIGFFLGGVPNSKININAFGSFADTATAAGIRQQFTHSRLCLCLDEFEQTGGNLYIDTQKREILAALRGNIGVGGKTVHGSKAGRAVEYEIRLPVFLAAIRELDRSEDISRFIPITMKRNNEREAPTNIITNKYSIEEIEELRRNIPLTMFHYAKKYRKAYKEIVEEYTKGDKKRTQSTRSRDPLFGAMAVMKLAGVNYDRFLRNYAKAHVNDFSVLKNDDFTDAILDTVLHTASLPHPDPEIRYRRSVSSILGESEDSLNEMRCGVYYDKALSLLIIHWPSVSSTIMSSFVEGKKPYTWFKKQMRRYTHTIDTEVALKAGVFSRLSDYVAGIKADLCTIINYGAIKSELEEEHTVKLGKGREVNTLDVLIPSGQKRGREKTALSVKETVTHTQRKETTVAAAAKILTSAGMLQPHDSGELSVLLKEQKEGYTDNVKGEGIVNLDVLI